LKKLEKKGGKSLQALNEKIIEANQQRDLYGDSDPDNDNTEENTEDSAEENTEGKPKANTRKKKNTRKKSVPDEYNNLDENTTGGKATAKSSTSGATAAESSPSPPSSPEATKTSSSRSRSYKMPTPPRNSQQARAQKFAKLESECEQFLDIDLERPPEAYEPLNIKLHSKEDVKGTTDVEDRVVIFRANIPQKDFDRHQMVTHGNKLIYRRPSISDSIGSQANKKKFNAECRTLGFPDTFIRETDMMLAEIHRDPMRRYVSTLCTFVDETIKLGAVSKEATSTFESKNGLLEMHTTIVFSITVKNTRRPKEVEQPKQSLFHKRQQEKAKQYAGYGAAYESDCEDDQGDYDDDFGMDDDGMFP